MTALIRFRLPLFVFNEGELAFAFRGINPRSLREYRKSSRRVVISRRVVWDIKFWEVAISFRRSVKNENAACLPLRKMF